MSKVYYSKHVEPILKDRNKFPLLFELTEEEMTGVKVHDTEYNQYIYTKYGSFYLEKMGNNCGTVQVYEFPYSENDHTKNYINLMTKILKHLMSYSGYNVAMCSHYRFPKLFKEAGWVELFNVQSPRENHKMYYWAICLDSKELKQKGYIIQ